MQNQTISQIFHIIVGESQNGCINGAATMEYFEKNHSGMYKENDLEAFVSCLDFDRIREFSTTLYRMAS